MTRRREASNAASYSFPFLSPTVLVMRSQEHSGYRCNSVKARRALRQGLGLDQRVDEVRASDSSAGLQNTRIAFSPGEGSPLFHSLSLSHTHSSPS